MIVDRKCDSLAQNGMFGRAGDGGGARLSWGWPRAGDGRDAAFGDFSAAVLATASRLAGGHFFADAFGLGRPSVFALSSASEYALKASSSR